MSWKEILRKEDYSIEEQIKLLLEDLAHNNKQVDFNKGGRWLMGHTWEDYRGKESLTWRSPYTGEHYLLVSLDSNMIVFNEIPADEWISAEYLHYFLHDREGDPKGLSKLKSLDWPHEKGMKLTDHQSIFNEITSEVNKRVSVLNNASDMSHYWGRTYPD